MNAAEWDELKALFAEASSLGSVERDLLLRTRCSDRPTLRRELDRLLAAHALEDGFLDSPVEACIESCIGAPLDSDRCRDTADAMLGTGRIGQRIGRYELITRIGDGGMGEVWSARRADDAYEMCVAVKLVRRTLRSPDARRRFCDERQLLARLEHPGVTRLLDGGTTDEGAPYLVMELVDGRPIEAFCDTARLDADGRIEAFLRACEPVRFAHRLGIVHRDLKSANVLVTRDGAVKLLDFGVAAMVDDASECTSERRRAKSIGLTPGCASPQQIAGEPPDPADDVFALGVLLERLLFRPDPSCPDAPSPTDSMTPDRRADLAAVVACARAPARQTRYADVDALIRDLRRVLSGDAVSVRAPRAIESARRVARRHRAAVVAGGVALSMLVLALAGTSVGAWRARSAERVARLASADAQEVVAFFEDLLGSAHPLRSGDGVSVLDLLDEAERRVERDFVGRGGVELGVRLAIARSHAALMRWTAVEPHARRAVSLAREHGDPGRLGDALSLHGRAMTHLRRSEAITIQREGLSIRREHFGAEDARVAESTGNLAFALWMVPEGGGDTEAAEHGYLEALASYERLGLGGSRDAARFTMSLGTMYRHLGREDEAEARFRRALAIYEELPRSEDSYEVISMLALANMLDELGRVDEAADLMERFRGHAPEPYFPGAHRTIAWRLAAIRRTQGDLAAAHAEVLRGLAADCDAIARRRLTTHERADARARQASEPSLPDRLRAAASTRAGDRGVLRPVVVDRAVVLEALGLLAEHGAHAWRAEALVRIEAIEPGWLPGSVG